MRPGRYWARSFTATDDDLDYLINLLLECETPLTSEKLALDLIQQRLNVETAMLEERYKNVRPYNPASSYQPGQKIVFPALDYVIGTVVDSRLGKNEAYGAFTVISVQFEDRKGDVRDFAADLSTSHKLSQEEEDGTSPLTSASDLTADEILGLNHDEIVGTVEQLLERSEGLVRLSDKWFPRDLILDVNVGHLNLAEAVLDLAAGSPLTTKEILNQMGGLGDAPAELQTFSLNYALNRDNRFDEVGPAGQVQWYLTRLEPPEVLSTPPMLQYRPIEYDRSLLTPEMLELEAEIGDSLSPLTPEEKIEQADITLSYPHRRLGTLPLNHKTRSVFPTARHTPRIWMTLVDGQDDEEFPGWVVPGEGYVFGLGGFYRKHRLPIGAYVSVRHGSTPDKVVVDFTAHRPRTEWIRLITPLNGEIHFENHKRAIGAAYDDLMILGVDDLQVVDTLYQRTPQQSLVSIIKTLIPELGRLSPQGTVHVKTLYSAVNVVRRCPPGPIMAALVASLDFQDVGGHYWKLAY